MQHRGDLERETEMSETGIPGMGEKTCSNCLEEKPYTEFYVANKIESRDGYRTWCKSCMREYSRKHRKANPDRVKENNKRFREGNPDYGKEYMAIWHAENEEHEKKYYEEKGRQISAQSQRRRRASKRLVEITLSDEEWMVILWHAEGRCFYCGDPWEEMDHFIPISKGGTHSKENVVPACQFCNRSKGAKDPFEFMAGRIPYAHT